MREFVRRLNRRTITTVFATVFTVTFLLAVFPPFYFAASGTSFAIWYWLIDALLLGLTLWALYGVESIRGELDEALPTRKENER